MSNKEYILGPTLRRVRIAKNMSQKFVANKLGISPAQLHRLELGKSSPKEEFVFKIIGFLLPELKLRTALVEAEVNATYRVM